MTQMLAAMLALLAMLSPADYRLARQVQGEAGCCDVSARIAAAHICQRSTCYGDATPDALTLWVVMHLGTLEDPTDGAWFLLSDADMELPHVREMVGPRVRSWECAGGLAVHAYRGRQ